MSYKVAIRKNDTGEIRMYEFVECVWDDDDYSGELFCWTDGNFSCDCNRELFWLRANDEDEPDEPECGNTRFTVLYAKLPNGEIIPIDGENQS